MHLPTSWNGCTTDELEAIAAAIITEQQRVDRYHHFDWSRVKLGVVLAVNHIEVVSDAASKLGITGRFMGDEEYLVRRSKDEDPWGITVGQLIALTERLSWIDDEKADKTIFLFPYPEMTLRKTAGSSGSRAYISHQPSAIIHLQGPPPLLDGYTWQEYRWMTDWMQAYMRHANAMAQSKMEDVRRKNAEAAAQAQREFLAILFKPAGKPAGTGTAEHTSAISHLTSDIFTDFSPVKWQVILFWWSSLMAMLAKKFPKVFKQQPVGKGKRRPQQQDTPWDFYNRVTATLADEYKTSEQDQRNETYSVTLQKLQNMAEKAAELEKLKHK